MPDDFPIESRFAIEARVGRGASGEVFKATDRATGLPVAVKRLLSIHDDAAGLDRFRREARLLSIVEDPRLVRYVAHGGDATLQPCLVVEWLEGEDLARRQRRQRLTVAEALDVAWQTALALHNLGGVRASLGRLDEARVDEERAVAAFRAGGDPRLEGASRVYLARILLSAGDAAGAEIEARQVAESAASPAPLRAGALAAVAEAMRAQGRAGEALIAAKEAAGLLSSIKSIEDFEVLIGLSHAEALEACGEPEAARAAVGEAWKRLSARAARLEGATRTRFLGAVVDNARCRAPARRWGVADAEVE
jgi:tetratricopeptide (TPR) repeat protein